MKQFFQILCYGAYRNQFIWHSPRESRLHSAPENVCHTAGRKICLKYKFCTMCQGLWHIGQGRLHGFQFGGMELPNFQNLATTTK